MADPTNMTDAELRTKLLEFGFPVMPITGTTRKVMEKKLKILMENKSKTNNEGRRSLARYSSEEESDVDSKVSKKDKNKRATMAAPPSRVTLRKSSRKIETDSDTEVRKPIVTEEKKISTRTTKITKVETGFDTGSDSESEIVEKTYNTNVNNHDYKRSFQTNPITSNISSSYVETTRKYSPPKLPEDVVSKNVTYSSGLSQSPSRYSSYGSNAGDYAADRLNQIRSRLSLGSPSYDRPMYTSPITTTSTVEREDDTVETPFLSNFTKRLSQLSSPNSLKMDEYKNDIIKEQDTNGSGTFATRTYLSRPVKRDFARDYHTGKQSTKNNLVPFAVIALAFLFFIVLAIVYMGLHNGQQTALDSITSDLKVNYCDNIPTAKPGINCIQYTDVRDAVKVYEALKPELVKKAVEHRCVDSKTKPYITEQDVIPYISKISKEHFEVHKSLRNMEILTLSNPQWEISVLKVTDDVLNEVPVKSFDELFDARDLSVIALSVVQPSLPWTCSVYNKLSAIFQSVLVLVVGFLSLYSLNMGYKYYKHYQQKQRDVLFYMIERIIDILQTNATEEVESFLVINHVRDMILPINDRSRMEKTWTKAVDFINKNESRVRTELQVVQGEPYEVWRWLGSPSLNTSGSPRSNKSWQGQAFETQVGSVNSLPCSPTPCLKIRGMVDDGDRNLHTIREAVLSKCAHQCRILHCAVDTNSKCVYLKCADQNDAAIAYRSLHGWWYAGNLVTVKYLRLERYMQRYPDSPVSGPPHLKAVQPATDWTN